MTFADRGLARVATSLWLMLGALIILPTLLPCGAFGQTGTKSAAQADAPAADAGQSLAFERGESDGIKVYALRLRPGQDLRKELERFTKERGLRAGFIITTVGSLQRAGLRLADKSEATSFEGKFEIVSLVGTLAQDGVHLHISISDGTGRTIGGHLVEGCQIYTTAEIVIGEASGMVFSRETDKATGYKELTIRQQRRPRKRR
jgi:predicted DNA-binding protein with PD1-like motif